MAKRRLVLSRRASIEYDEIAAFSFQRFGLDVADTYMAGLDTACERLRDYPELAPTDPRIRPEVRVLHQSRATPTAL